jgi:hypothetical protein
MDANGADQNAIRSTAYVCSVTVRLLLAKYISIASILEEDIGLECSAITPYNSDTLMITKIIKLIITIVVTELIQILLQLLEVIRDFELYN